VLGQTALVFMASLVLKNFTQEQPKHTNDYRRKSYLGPSPAISIILYHIILRIIDLDGGSSLSEVTQV
jgi:hypothetical protein